MTNATSLLWRAWVYLAQLSGTDTVIEAGEHWLPGNSSDAWLPLMKKGMCDFVIDCVYSNGCYLSSLALKEMGNLIIPVKFAIIILKQGTRSVTWSSAVVNY